MRYTAHLKHGLAKGGSHVISYSYILEGAALNATISINMSNSPTNPQKFNILINGGIYLK
jgi:hypothetical protein